MSPEDARVELERLDMELTVVRQQLAAHRTTQMTKVRAPDLPVWIWPVAILGAIAIGGLSVAGSYFAGESPALLWWGVGVFVVAGGLAAELFRRKLLPEGRSADRSRRVLLDRRAALIEEAQAVYDALGDREPVPGPGRLALPAGRQPHPWAEMMTMRFRRATPPDAELRALPPSPSPALVWFHRRIGRGALWPLAMAMALVVLTVIRLT